MLPRATFLGTLTGSALATAYASSDLFLYPSTTEGWGATCLEAQVAAHTLLAASWVAPFLTSRVPPLTAIITPARRLRRSSVPIRAQSLRPHHTPQASGLPLVATRSPGIIDVTADGESGFLAAPGNESEMADAAARLLSDASLRRTMGEKVVRPPHVAHQEQTPPEISRNLPQAATHCIVRPQHIVPPDCASRLLRAALHVPVAPRRQALSHAAAFDWAASGDLVLEAYLEHAPSVAGVAERGRPPPTLWSRLAAYGIGWRPQRFEEAARRGAQLVQKQPPTTG